MPLEFAIFVSVPFFLDFRKFPKTAPIMDNKPCIIAKISATKIKIPRGNKIVSKFAIIGTITVHMIKLDKKEYIAAFLLSFVRKYPIINPATIGVKIAKLVPIKMRSIIIEITVVDAIQYTKSFISKPNAIYMHIQGIIINDYRKL